MLVFEVQNALKFVFFFVGLVSRSFLSISESKIQRLGLPNRGCRMEGIAKTNFSWKSFLMHFGIDVYRFLIALGTVFLICSALKTSLKHNDF